MKLQENIYRLIVHLFSVSESCVHRAAEQSVHWTLGILRDLQAFFWLRVLSALKQNPRPPTRG